MTLTEEGAQRRIAIIRFVTEYQQQHHMAPSIREIAEAVGIVSKTAVRHHLETLRREGRVTWEDGKFRSLKVM